MLCSLLHRFYPETEACRLQLLQRKSSGQQQVIVWQALHAIHMPILHNTLKYLHTGHPLEQELVRVPPGLKKKEKYGWGGAANVPVLIALPRRKTYRPCNAETHYARNYTDIMQSTLSQQHSTVSLEFLLKGQPLFFNLLSWEPKKRQNHFAFLLCHSLS